MRLRQHISSIFECLLGRFRRLPSEAFKGETKRESRLWVHPFVPQGELFVMADIDHPEIDVFDQMASVDGSVLLCHPDDEGAARDVLASLGEHFDTNEALTAFRRGLRNRGTT